MRGEAADHLGQPFFPQEVVPEYPVADTAPVVKLAGVVVQPVHAHVVHDHAVRIHALQCRGARRVLLVQGEDLLVGGKPHALEFRKRLTARPPARAGGAGTVDG